MKQILNSILELLFFATEEAVAFSLDKYLKDDPDYQEIKEDMNRLANKLAKFMDKIEPLI